MAVMWKMKRVGDPLYRQRCAFIDRLYGQDSGAPLYRAASLFASYSSWSDIRTTLSK
jgi:hypothetical protein